MSNLRPIGIPVNFDGVDRYFLFTFRRIDELQSRHPGMNIFEQVRAAQEDTVDGLMHVINLVDVLCDGALTTKDIMNSLKKNPVTGRGTLTDVRTGFNLALDESMPVPTEDDDADPDGEATGIFEIPRFLVITTGKFGLTQAEFWEMTPRKFSLLNDAHLTVNGLKKKEEHMSLLDLP